MNRFKYAFQLLGELIQFSRKRKIYWLIPLMFILLPIAFFIVMGETAAPLIYTFF